MEVDQGISDINNKESTDDLNSTHKAHPMLFFEGTRFLNNKCRSNSKEINRDRPQSNCVLNHSTPNISKIFCPKCKEDVCIDCHLFHYERDIEHQEAIVIIKKSLVETQPLKDIELKSGFYPATDVLKRMRGNPIIDPKPISASNKELYFMKILRVYNSDGKGEFVLKQIIGKAEADISKIMKNAKFEYQFMDKLKHFCILSYNFGSTEYSFEMLMENWGRPLDQVNFRILNQSTFFQILRRCALILVSIYQEHIFHGDIKMENIILNEICSVPKFIDFGISHEFQNFEELTRLKFAINDSQPIRNIIGLTYHMAPYEILQYMNIVEKNEIKYNHMLLDVFCMGLTFFAMLLGPSLDFRTMQKLQKLRDYSETEQEFLEEIQKIFDACRDELPWEKEFVMKIFEICKFCMQTIDVRLTATELFEVLRYFPSANLEELKDLLNNRKEKKIFKLIQINDEERFRSTATKPSAILAKYGKI